MIPGAGRVAGVAVVALAVAAPAVLPPGPAAASISNVSPSSLANTSTATPVTIASSTPSTVFTVPAAQVEGPGAFTDTYAGASPVVTPVDQSCAPPIPPLPPVCLPGTGTSSVATSFDLDTGNLPAGPGTYSLEVCSITCLLGSATGDTSSITVTGSPPAPTGTASPVTIAPGGQGAATIVGSGFAKHDTVAGPSGITFAVANPQGTATSLAGTVSVGSAVADGSYSLTVTDTAGHSGVCTDCVTVGSGGTTTGKAKTTKLTLAMSSKRVRFGKPVRLSGMLAERGAHGEPLAHQPVKVLAKPAGAATYTLLKTVKTSSSGRYAVATKPHADTTYASFFGGKLASGASPGDVFSFSTSTRHVVVRPVIVARAKTKRSAHTRPLVVLGRVKPNQGGNRVTIARLVGSHRHKLGRATLSSSSHFRFVTSRLAKPGRYRLIVILHHATGRPAAVSKAITVRRT